MNNYGETAYYRIEYEAKSAFTMRAVRFHESRVRIIQYNGNCPGIYEFFTFNKRNKNKDMYFR